MNKIKIFLLTILIVQSINSFSQEISIKSDKVRYDGIYVGKVKEVEFGGRKMELYLYIKLFDDGSVYTQTVNSYSPIEVNKWLGKDGKFERSGTISINEKAIKILTNNFKSKDKNLEGEQVSNYSGRILNKEKLKLKFDNTASIPDSIDLSFVQTADTLKMQFVGANKKVIIPGNWTIVKESANQMYLKNLSETVISVSVANNDNFPTYKKENSIFENVKQYYLWESEYQKTKYNRQINIEKENIDENYIIWSSESQEHTDKNIFLNGANSDLLFVMLIVDNKLTNEEQIKILEEIYKLNI